MLIGFQCRLWCQLSGGISVTNNVLLRNKNNLLEVSDIVILMMCFACGLQNLKSGYKSNPAVLWLFICVHTFQSLMLNLSHSWSISGRNLSLKMTPWSKSINITRKRFVFLDSYLLYMFDFHCPCKYEFALMFLPSFPLDESQLDVLCIFLNKFVYIYARNVYQHLYIYIYIYAYGIHISYERVSMCVMWVNIAWNGSPWTNWE